MKLSQFNLGFLVIEIKRSGPPLNPLGYKISCESSFVSVSTFGVERINNLLLPSVGKSEVVLSLVVLLIQRRGGGERGGDESRAWT